MDCVCNKDCCRNCVARIVSYVTTVYTNFQGVCHLSVAIVQTTFDHIFTIISTCRSVSKIPTRIKHEFFIGKVASFLHFTRIYGHVFFVCFLNARRTSTKQSLKATNLGIIKILGFCPRPTGNVQNEDL